MFRQNRLACLLFLLLAPGFLATYYTLAYNSLHLEMFAFLGWGVLALAGGLKLSTMKNLRMDKTAAGYASLLFSLPAVVLLGQQATELSIPYFGMVLIALYYLAVGACVCWLGAIAAAWLHGLPTSSTDGPEKIRAALKAVVWVATASALVGIAQYLQLPVPELLVSPVTRIGASYGNLRQPNLFALLGVLGLIALIVLQVKVAGSVQSLSNKLAAFYFLTLLAGIVLSTSRAGTLLVVMIFVWGVIESWIARKPKWIMLLTLPTYFILHYLVVQIDLQGILQYYGTVRPGLVSSAIEGDYWRQTIWLKSLALVKAHPVWGVGYGNIAFSMFTEILPVPHPPVTEHAHNIFLQMAVELGTPVMAAWTAILVMLVIRTRHALKVFEGRVLAFFLLVVLTHNLLEYPLWYSYFLLPTAFVLGIFTQSNGIVENKIKILQDNSTHIPENISTRQSIPGHGGLYAKMVGIGGMFTIMLAMFGLWDYAKVSPSYAIDTAEPLHDRIIHSYTSVLFLNLADYAALGLSGVSPETALVQLRLAKRVAHFRFDPQVAAVHAAAAALAGQMSLAKASAYRLWLKDKDASERLRLALVSSNLPQAKELASFLANPVFSPWP